jgi:PAS domain S-box-containing protein
LNTVQTVSNPAGETGLIGGGQVGARLAAFDWTRSPLGPPERWPEPLPVTAQLCLNSPFPLILWWGEALAPIYNDDWINLAGPPPDAALARPGETGWPELWQAMGPQLRHVLATGATIETDKLTGAFAKLAFSHIPVRHADGSAGGVLSAVRESVAREGLRRERELLLSIIDNIPVMITLYEPGEKLLRVNREFERALGWKAAELDNPSIMEERYPDPLYREQIRRFIETSHPDWMDIRMRARDGRFVETAWANIRISDQTQVGIGLDITERKHADEQRTLLINELNHRVKNTLATVQSLAMQSLRGGMRGIDARDRFEARLTALARAHDLLTMEGWRGAPLGDIVERAMAPFRTSDARVAVAGPALRLNTKQALAISMAMHELGTNALKYGALSNDTGRVSIDWRTQQANGIAVLDLSWREEGGPPVRAPTRKGFGSRLLEKNLARELDGTVIIDYRREGVACRVTCRLEEQYG